MTERVERYLKARAGDVRDHVLRPENNDESVRIHSDGFVTFTDSGELFAAVDLWTGPAAGEEEIETLAYILKEAPQTEVTEEGVDRFFDVAFGRLRPFLRAPDTPEAPVYVYSSGLVTLAPEDVPFAQLAEWEEDEDWRLAELSEQLGSPILSRPWEDDTPPVQNEDEDEDGDEDFW